MDLDELAIHVAEIDQRSKSNTHRLNEVSEKIDTLQRLTTAVEVMAMEQKHQTDTMEEIKTDVTNLGQKVDVIEKRPGRRWDNMVGYVLSALAAGMIAFLLGRIGL